MPLRTMPQGERRARAVCGLLSCGRSRCQPGRDRGCATGHNVDPVAALVRAPATASSIWPRLREPFAACCHAANHSDDLAAALTRARPRPREPSVPVLAQPVVVSTRSPCWRELRPRLSVHGRASCLRGCSWRQPSRGRGCAASHGVDPTASLAQAPAMTSSTRALSREPSTASGRTAGCGVDPDAAVVTRPQGDGDGATGQCNQGWSGQGRGLPRCGLAEGKADGGAQRPKLRATRTRCAVVQGV